MRLDKFVCKSTELTRTQAIQCIHLGEVQVNGVAVLSERAQVHENNEVWLNGKRLTARAFRYLLLHKPAGMVCSNIDEVYPSIFNCLEIEKVDELHIVGRLDADTTGLVLITDDGRWSFNITRPINQCSKTYRVQLVNPISNHVIELFEQGVHLQGESQLTLPATLKIVSDKEVLLNLTEGRFHQVKRMFSAVGNRVKALHREAIGDVCLDVDLGEWRHLTAEEVCSFQ